MKFRYEAMDLNANNEYTEGEIEADSKDEVPFIMGEMRLFPTKICEVIDHEDPPQDDLSWADRRASGPMRTFEYKAIDPTGNPSSGTIEATDSDDAVRKIRESGIYPTKVGLISGKVKAAKDRNRIAAKAATLRAHRKAQGDPMQCVAICAAIISRLSPLIIIIALSFIIGHFVSSVAGWTVLLIVGFFVVNNMILNFRKKKNLIKEKCACGSHECACGGECQKGDKS